MQASKTKSIELRNRPLSDSGAAVNVRDIEGKGDPNTICDFYPFNSPTVTEHPVQRYNDSEQSIAQHRMFLVPSGGNGMVHPITRPDELGCK